MHQAVQTIYNIDHHDETFDPEIWLWRIEQLGAKVDLVRGPRGGNAAAMTIAYEGIKPADMAEVTHLEECAIEPTRRRKLFDFLRSRSNKRVVAIEAEREPVLNEMGGLSAEDPEYDDRFWDCAKADGELVTEMLRTPASSPAAIAVKLREALVFSERESAQEDCIKSALADLDSLTERGCGLITG